MPRAKARRFQQADTLALQCLAPCIWVRCSGRMLRLRRYCAPPGRHLFSPLHARHRVFFDQHWNHIQRERGQRYESVRWSFCRGIWARLRSNDMERLAICMFAVVGTIGCADAAPPEPVSARAHAVAPGPTTGYFSVGCEAAQTNEDRLVSEAGLPRRALVLGRLLRDAGPQGRRRFSGPLTSHEYDLRQIHVQPEQVLLDRDAVLAPGELRLLVTDPSSVVRYDNTGNMFVPFPGSSFRAAADEHSQRGGLSVFLIEQYEGALFVTGTADVRDGAVVGDSAPIALDAFMARVAARQQDGGR